MLSFMLGSFAAPPHMMLVQMVNKGSTPMNNHLSLTFLELTDRLLTGAAGRAFYSGVTAALVGPVKFFFEPVARDDTFNLFEP